MGDRCYLEVSTDSESLQKLAEVLGLDQDDFEIDGDIQQIVIEEANYALQDEMLEASDKGCRFIGWHGDGGDYNSAIFASDGDIFWSHDTIDGEPAIPLCADADIFSSRLRTALEFVIFHDKVAGMVGQE